MDKLKKIQGALLPLLSILKKWCKDAWHSHLEKVKQRREEELAQRTQAQQDEIQQELAYVLQNFSYPKLVQVHSVADLRQDGHKKRMGKVTYYFTIDKTVWEPFPLAVCNIMKDSMNKDIFMFQRNLAISLFMEDIFNQYPALYYGMRVTAIENQEIMLRLAVVTDMPL